MGSILGCTEYLGKGSTTPDNDEDDERPRHIISKTPDEIACIRAAMKGDGVLRKLSEGSPVSRSHPGFYAQLDLVLKW